MKNIYKHSSMEEKMYWIDEKVYQETNDAFNSTIRIYDGIYGDTLTFMRTESHTDYWECTNELYD